MLYQKTLAALSLASTALAQQHIATDGLIQNNSTSASTRLRYDNGTYGPLIEEVHYCKDLLMPKEMAFADQPRRLRPMADWNRGRL